MKTIGESLQEAFSRLGSENHIPLAEGDFIGPEDIVHCGVCREAKEYRLPNKHYVPALCLCGRKRRAMEELRRKEAEEMQRVEELARYSLIDDKLRNASLETITIRDDNRRAVGIAKRYVEAFDEICKSTDLNGILMYGPTGTGKSYLSACIANDLMKKRVPVLMTSIIKLTSRIDELSDIYPQMRRARLLVLDDLGAERGTDFKLEQVYSIIDDRCNQRRPMIVTTNLSMDEMKNAGDMRYNRIWERVRSMCYPIRMDGENWRKGKTLEAMRRLKAMYEG